MKDEDVKPGWSNPPPGIDDVEPKTIDIRKLILDHLKQAGIKDVEIAGGADGSGFTLARGTGVPKDLTGVEFMVDTQVPPLWQGWLGRKVRVALWTPKHGWKVIAWFNSSHAAREYSEYVAKKLHRIKNAERGR